MEIYGIGILLIIATRARNRIVIIRIVNRLTRIGHKRLNRINPVWSQSGLNRLATNN